jgi:hypothetical protein
MLSRKHREAIHSKAQISTLIMIIVFVIGFLIVLAALLKIFHVF